MVEVKLKNKLRCDDFIKNTTELINDQKSSAWVKLGRLLFKNQTLLQEFTLKMRNFQRWLLTFQPQTLSTKQANFNIRSLILLLTNTTTGGSCDEDQQTLGAFQEFPQVEACRLYSKFSSRPTSLAMIPQVVEKAIRVSFVSVLIFLENRNVVLFFW